MAHGKETPRQKMIGMMYLVLTALLALNVSKSILDAFVIVDNGLTKTNENFASNNQLIYDEFDKAYTSSPNKVGEWKKKSDNVRKESNDLFDYIQNLKLEIVRGAEGQNTKAIEDKKIEGEKIEAKDNTDIPAQIMVGAENNGKGKELKKKIDNFRETILSYVNPKETELINSIKKTLDTSDPPAKEGEHLSWETANFEHWPLIAVTTILSKIQSDVRNAEAEAVKYLYGQIDKGSFKFNKLEATYIPNSNYVLKGNEYTAQVFMAAMDTTQRPSIYIGNYKEIKDANGNVDYEMVGSYDSLAVDPKTGKYIYRRQANSVGTVKWGGIIQLKSTDGTIKRAFNAEYIVSEATAVISPTKMNVFYLGVDNPVAISVPGVTGDKVFPTITNGVIKKVAANSYIVNPRSIGNAIVMVDAEIDGKRKSMGNMEFRVKRIPDPIAKVAGRKGGTILKNELAAQSIVQADLENFEFDLKFNVTRFTFSVNKNGFSTDVPGKGNRITPEMQEMIRGLNRGERVLFLDIYAIGPDGVERELGGISFKLQ